MSVKFGEGGGEAPAPKDKYAEQLIDGSKKVKVLSADLYLMIENFFNEIFERGAEIKFAGLSGESYTITLDKKSYLDILVKLAALKQEVIKILEIPGKQFNRILPAEKETPDVITEEVRNNMPALLITVADDTKAHAENLFDVSEIAFLGEADVVGNRFADEFNYSLTQLQKEIQKIESYFDELAIMFPQLVETKGAKS